MGVGYPEDLVVSVALGADMFDCVWPTRTAVSSDSPPFFKLPMGVAYHYNLAVWQRHHLQGQSQSPSCLFCA